MAPTAIGRYEIRAQLGVGGFASVYRARDPSLDDDVAVKVLLARYAADADIRDRFIREARLLRRVHSPSVVDVFDIGELDDGTPYFVMEFIGGGSLDERIPSDGGIDVPSVVRIVDGVEQGLQALHAVGVVHRDIKPDNLLVAGAVDAPPRAAPAPSATAAGAVLGAAERVVITDLGFAKDTAATAVGPTVAGGTPYFRAPEQELSGAEITPAADVYAATALLWRLLTGELPPRPDTLAVHLPSLPSPLQMVFERGMHIDPELRHPSIAVWAADVRQALGVAPATSGGAAAAMGPDASPAARPGPADGGSNATVVGPGSTGGVALADLAQLCPYKGMAAFQPEDAGLFFGRDVLLDTLVAQLLEHRVLVVGGPSGSGKSSLVRAGLIPRLQRGALPGSQRWDIALFTPGNDPAGELAHQLERMRPSVPGDPPLTGTPDLPGRARRRIADGTGVLLVIDQFEEVFTLTEDPAQRMLLLESLAALTSSAHSTARVVIAMRADFYGASVAYPWLAEQINAAQTLVGAMSRVELRAAITTPAQRTGLLLEDGLVDVVLDDVGSDVGALPLLGHALVETWLRRRGSTLTIEGYRGAGGVSGAIAQRAEGVCASMTGAEQDSVRRLMLRLTNPGEGTPDTRRRVSLTALRSDPEMPPIVDTLAAARLLTVDDDSVEVAHEALLQSWPRLRNWIDADREQLQFRRRLGRAAADWIANDRSDDLLYRGTALATAIEWLDGRAAGEVDADTEAFVIAGRERREHERAAQRVVEERTRRNRRRAVTALAVLTVAALVASVVAFGALRRSQANERAAERAVVQALATAARADAATQPLTGLALALESIARSSEPSAIARDALVTSRAQLAEAPFLPTQFGPPIDVGDVISVAVSADGSLFMTGGRTGEVVVWDRATRTELERIQAHDRGVEAFAAAPNENVVVSVGGNSALVWELDPVSPGIASPPKLLLQLGANARMWDVAFSPDARMVAIVTESDGLVTVDAATGRSVGPAFVVPGVDFLSVAFVDERHVVVGDGRGAIWVVDVVAGGTLPPEVDVTDARPGIDVAIGGDQGNDVWELVVDHLPQADGTDRVETVVYSSSDDNTVRSFAVADLASDVVATDATTPLRPIGQPIDAIDSPRGIELVDTSRSTGPADDRIGDGVTVNLDPSATLVIGGGEGRLWARTSVDTAQPSVADTSGAGLITAGRAHTDRIIDSASGGGWLVTLGDDQVAQVWWVPGAEAIAAPPVLRSDVGQAIALSGDERFVAVGTPSGTVVADIAAFAVDGSAGAAAAGEAAVVADVAGEALAVAFDDRDRLVMAGRNGVVRVIDVASGSTVADADVGTTVRSLAVADDALVVVGGDDGRVTTWSLDGLGFVAELAVHNAAVTDLVIPSAGGARNAVVSVGFDGVRVSELDGTASRLVPATQDGVRTVAVDPSGTYLAVGGAQERVDVLRLEDGGDGQLAASLSPHPGGVWDVAFTPDGATIVATGREGAVVLWDWRTGARLGPAFVLHPSVEGVPSGPVIAVDTAGRIWTAGTAGTAGPTAEAAEPAPRGVVRRFDVLDLDRACALSAVVINETMRTEVLSGEPIQACDDTSGT